MVLHFTHTEHVICMKKCSLNRLGASKSSIDYLWGGVVRNDNYFLDNCIYILKTNFSDCIYCV